MKNLIFGMIYLAIVFSPISAMAKPPDDPHSAARDEAKRLTMKYRSASTLYVEELVEGRWMGRYWAADGHDDPAKYWKSDAFEICIQESPLPAARSRVIATGWRYVSEAEMPDAERGAKHIVVDLCNEEAALAVRVHTLIDQTPILTRWLEIKNTSSTPIALTAVSPWSGRLWAGDAPAALGHSIRREVLWEGWFGWDTLRPGLNNYDNDSNRLWDDPYFILRNETSGNYFFGQLAWPATYAMEFDNADGISFKIGPSAPHTMRVIDPDETVSTPSVHLGCVSSDFDACVQGMLDHVRKSVLPSYAHERSYRIQYLIPEDQPMTVYHGDDFNEENLLKCVEVAAATGMEVFILDGPMWCTAYGKWLEPAPKLYPRGLSPLIDFVREKGMLFGLYFESEGGRDGIASPDRAPIGNWSESEVFQQHPDWFTNTNLNLAIPEAADYFKAELARIIEHYQLDLYRHDQNGIVFHPGGPGSGATIRNGYLENNRWRHYDALYDAFALIHEKYPELILQSASAGGFRLDLATLSRFHEHFTSDRAQTPTMYRMLSGLSVYLPPEACVSPHGMTRQLPDVDTSFRAAYALGGTPMIFNSLLPKSLEELTPEFQAKCLHYANLYKTFIRPILPTCKVWHHAPVNAMGGVTARSESPKMPDISGNWLAMEFTSPDESKGWATIIRLGEEAEGGYLLKPRGLSEEREYRVTIDSSGRTRIVSGAQLTGKGILITPIEDSSSELVLFEAD